MLSGVVGVTQACRENGVSRTTYYRWVSRAERYGLSALMPKERRRPHVSTQTPAHEEEIILAEAILVCDGGPTVRGEDGEKLPLLL